MNRYAIFRSRLEIVEQVQDLRLDRDVERADRFVADDEVGVERERAGDADALALAAGEFVRVARRRRLGSRPTRREQAGDHLVASRLPVAMPWTSIGSPTMLPTVMRGLRLLTGSWKMICICRRSRRSSSPW